jgi:hypothetical protein
MGSSRKNKQDSIGFILIPYATLLIFATRSDGFIFFEI